MNTHITKSFLLALVCATAMLVGFSTMTSAQPSEQASVSATVLSALTVTRNADLDFKNVLPGFNKSVAADGTPTYGAGGSGETAAKFTIAGAASRAVTLNFTTPTNLSSGSDNLIISFANLGVYNTTDSPSGGTSFTPSSSTAATLSSSGNLYIYLGGQVQPTYGQATGTYTGTVTVSVTYSGS